MGYPVRNFFRRLTRARPWDIPSRSVGPVSGAAAESERGSAVPGWFVARLNVGCALVLELVDRHDSGSCVGNGVGVRVSPRAFFYFLGPFAKLKFSAYFRPL